MSIGTVLKAFALFCWLLSFIWFRFPETYKGYNLVGAGLFFWYFPDLVHLP